MGGVGDFEPREGEVKVVFRSRVAGIGRIRAALRGAGFELQGYYQPALTSLRREAVDEFVQLAAVRSLTEFTAAELDAATADFESAQRGAGFECDILGVDSWTAGNDAGPAGVREPRRPLPTVGAGTAAIPADRDNSTAYRGPRAAAR